MKSPKHFFALGALDKCAPANLSQAGALIFRTQPFGPRSEFTESRI